MRERCRREEKVGGGKVFVVGEGRVGDLGDCLLGGYGFGSEIQVGKLAAISVILTRKFVREIRMNMLVPRLGTSGQHAN
jgi:hypothetical protein